MLRATTACTFSTSQLLKVLRSWGVFTFFPSKCASGRNRVQLFISLLARWLRTRRFSEVTLRPSGDTNRFPTFLRTCIFFLHTSSPLWSSLFFSSPLWLFPPLLFHLCILSEVSLLNFLRLWFSWIHKIHWWFKVITMSGSCGTLSLILTQISPDPAWKHDQLVWVGPGGLPPNGNSIGNKWRRDEKPLILGCFFSSNFLQDHCFCSGRGGGRRGWGGSRFHGLGKALGWKPDRSECRARKKTEG